MPHPDHDAIAQTVRGWFTYSAPEMGYQREQRRFGVYGRHLSAGDEVMIRQLALDEVPAFLADVRAYFGGASVRLYVEDRALDETLRPALTSQAGCVADERQGYLAHVGPPP